MRRVRHRVAKEEEEKRRKEKKKQAGNGSNGPRRRDGATRSDRSREPERESEASREAERGEKRVSVAATPCVTRSTSLQLLQGNAGVTAVIFMAGREIIISYFA